MKNPLYLDIEDDITAIITKLKKTKDDFVKLVPAKRSTVFTSVVNLKLLKKAADQYEKDFALITENPHLKSLASKLDIKVAKSIQDDVAVPKRKDTVDLPSTTIDPRDTVQETDKASPSSTAADTAKKNAEENVSAKAGGFKAAVASMLGVFKRNGKSSDTGKEDHSTAKGVPNFRKFRKKLIFGILLLFLAGGGIGYALVNAPKAAVTLEAQTRSKLVDFEFVADSEAEVADTEESMVPAKAETITKSATSKFTATGEKNVGQKATGTITIENCDRSSELTLVENTTFKYIDGKNYFSTTSVNVPGATFSDGGSECDPGVANVPVIAEKRGDAYNVEPNDDNPDSPNVFTLPNLDDGIEENLDLDGSKMTGGSTEIVKVVTQGDVDNARQALLAKDIEQTKLEFTNRFEEEVIVLDDSFTQTVNRVNSIPNVGDQLPKNENEATLSIDLTYFQFALEKNQLEILVHDQLESDLKDGEKISDAGIDSAEIELVSKVSQSQQIFSFDSETIIGPDVDEEKVANEIAGMGYSEAIKHAESYPHVVKALVDLSPFWVFSIPDDPQQIEVEIKILE